VLKPPPDKPTLDGDPTWKSLIASNWQFWRHWKNKMSGSRTWLAETLSAWTEGSRECGGDVAQLIVRDLSEDLVKALKQRAAKRNHSTEQEHREILQSVLRGPKRRHLADVLAEIPNVGKDSDFEREQSDQRGWCVPARYGCHQRDP
jgi:antitoxin FitA